MDNKKALIATDGADNPNDVKICPITKDICTLDACVLWLVLDDWVGCPFDLASDGLKQAALIGASKLSALEQSSDVGAKAAGSITSLIRRMLEKKED